MVALQTRARLAVQVSQEVEIRRAQGAQVIEGCRVDEQGASTCIAQGYETVQTVTAQVDGETQCWQERRLLVQSIAARSAAGSHLQERLQKAQQELAQLTTRRQGKPRLTTRTEVDEAIKAVLKRFRVEGLLQVQIQEEVHERPVRAYRGRLSGVRRDLSFRLSCERMETAIARAISQLGWRVYATNHLVQHLTVEQAVEAYRDEYLVERNFSRLKGHPLSLAPLYVQRDDHRVGLVRLFTLALRVLTLLEGVVRQRLVAQQEELAGLFAGNPKRQTAHPTAERFQQAFREVTLTIVSAPGFAQRHVTPLSSLQQQILTLLGCSSAVYLRLADDS